MLWQEINFTCEKSSITILEDYMLNLGACSVTFKDAEDIPILEPALGETPLWDKVSFTALFTDDHDLQDLLQNIKQSHPSIINSLNSHTFADEDWERTWMDNFKPLQFGKRLWVCPSWETPPNPNAINILLDPGLAFGTGTHETTALCLSWLDQHIKGHESVIDYGCGSGILAVAAKKLGASQVYGIDIAPQAVTATQDNAIKNDIDPKDILVFLADEQPETLQTDIVVANILAGILIELFEHINAKVKPSGTIVLSGILREQADEVLLHYSQSFQMNAPTFKGDWALLSGTKKC